MSSDLGTLAPPLSDMMKILNTLFDEFLKASISFRRIDRKKDSEKRCQLPGGIRHGILAALEGT